MQRRNTAFLGICLLGATVSCSGGLVSVGDRDRDASGSTGGSSSVGVGGTNTGTGGSSAAGAGGVTSGAGGSATGGGSPDAACVLTGACLQNYHPDPVLCRCVPDTPDADAACVLKGACLQNYHPDPVLCRCVPDLMDAGCVSGPRGPCGGNT